MVGMLLTLLVTEALEAYTCRHAFFALSSLSTSYVCVFARLCYLHVKYKQASSDMC